MEAHAKNRPNRRRREAPVSWCAVLAGAALMALVVRSPAQLGKVLGAHDLRNHIFFTFGAPILGIEFGPGTDPRNPGAPMRDFLWLGVRGANQAPPHHLLQVDIHAAGGPVVVRRYPVPAAVDNTTWGFQDLAHDPGTNLLYGVTWGSTTVFAFDCSSLAWVPSRDIPVTGALGFNYFGLALDPINRRLFLCGFNSPFFEIAMATGQAVAMHPNHGATGVMGLAYMETGRRRGMLWSACQQGSTGLPGNAPGSWVFLREHDAANQCWPTGLATYGHPAIPCTPANGGWAAGIAFARDGFYGPNKFVLWCVQQSTWVTAIDPEWEVGLGCAGSASNTPAPGMAGDAPYLGNQAWQLNVAGAGVATAAFLWLGGSRTSWLGLSLPLDLTPMGLTGCQIAISWNCLAGAAAVNQGAATVNVPIPNIPAFSGVDLFGQWLLHDPGWTGRPPFVTTTGFGFTLK